MGMMGLLVIITVILRYFFGISYIWAEELVTRLFILTTFFGAVVAIEKREHIKIDFFLKMMPKKTQQILADVIIQIIIIIVQIQVIRSSIKWIKIVGNAITPGMRIPTKYIYIFLPLSALLIIFYSLYNIYNYFKSKQLIKT
jgi:TRAP-type transport system small permease protein